MRSGKMRYILIIMATIFGLATAMSQKKITPVDNDPDKPAQPILHYYDKHGEPLEEPVLFISQTDTTTSSRPQPVYPLLYSANIGFNFFDGVMMAFGQKHASFDIQASLSLHNWIEPVIECGLGFANNKPELSNFRYRNKPSFYGKIGLNYNFLYKSNPDYQVFLGVRAGYTSFKYEITDITINSDYWDQSNKFSIMNQHAHAFYGQALVGLKVKLWKWVSMGWSFRYGFKFKATNGSNSNVWFIPGYGTGALGATFSLIFTIPINTKKIERNITLPDFSNKGEPHVSGGIPEP